MPSILPTAIPIQGDEKEELHQLITRHNTPQQIALRARIIVLAGQGYNHQNIARELNISRKMVRLWRERWQSGRLREMSVLDCLSDAERSGTPATFKPEQILHLFSIACESPELSGRPISHWTARELAIALVALLI